MTRVLTTKQFSSAGVILCHPKVLKLSPSQSSILLPLSNLRYTHYTTAKCRQNIFINLLFCVLSGISARSFGMGIFNLRIFTCARPIISSNYLALQPLETLLLIFIRSPLTFPKHPRFETPPLISITRTLPETRIFRRG